MPLARCTTKLRPKSTLPIYDSLTMPAVLSAMRSSTGIRAPLERGRLVREHFPGAHLRVGCKKVGDLRIIEAGGLYDRSFAPRRRAAAERAMRPASCGTRRAIGPCVAAPSSVRPACDYEGFLGQGRSNVRHCRTSIKTHVNPHKSTGWKPFFANLPPFSQAPPAIFARPRPSPCRRHVPCTRRSPMGARLYIKDTSDKAVCLLTDVKNHNFQKRCRKQAPCSGSPSDLMTMFSRPAPRVRYG